MIDELNVVAMLRVHGESDALLDSTGSTSSLSCIGTGDKRLDESRDLSLLVVGHLAMSASVDDL